jgi:hypothetical protein
MVLLHLAIVLLTNGDQVSTAADINGFLVLPINIVVIRVVPC